MPIEIGVYGLEEFEAACNKAADSVHVAFKAKKDKIAWTLLSRIVLATPVDTGRARGNWGINIGEVGRTGWQDTVLNDKVGYSTIDRGTEVIDRSPPWSSLTLYNNVPYIRKLEGGSSKQARPPGTMMKLNVVAVRALMRSGVL